MRGELICETTNNAKKKWFLVHFFGTLINSGKDDKGYISSRFAEYKTFTEERMRTILTGAVGTISAFTVLVDSFLKFRKNKYRISNTAHLPYY